MFKSVYHSRVTFVRGASVAVRPYAVRRYNGSGVNSYHYQAQVLLRVLNE